ncbi:MAG: hypothetical protein HZB67_03725, partial [Candidatus Aenigmarchaeota archaeon]|nr:hypothetical protein [Candidatus Aenigmarchaeota archaeon]
MHSLEAKPYHVKSGSWCSVCAGNLKLSIEEMRQLAELKGGNCLSKGYVNARSKLRWQCDKGHVWEARPDDITHGKWCPKCGRIRAANKQKLTIDEMREIAKAKGSKCLSPEYVNEVTKLMWECARGHAWEATPRGIKQGKWCPYCAGNVRLSIAEMHRIAESREGKCLSEKYVNSKTKLEWQCKNGHVWKASVDNVKAGKWCPFCAGRPPVTIEDIKRLAESKGGKCLSTKYTNMHTSLLWQ